MKIQKGKKKLLPQSPCNPSAGNMLECFLLLFVPIPNVWFLLWVGLWWLSHCDTDTYVGRKALILSYWSVNHSHPSCHLPQHSRYSLPPIGRALLQENYASLAWSSKLSLPFSITDDGRSCRIMFHSKACPLMTVVVILLLYSALLFPITLSAVLEALRTHVTWTRNLHVTALCTLRGKSIILPGSSQVNREETAEEHFLTKSICFCLLLSCFWSTCRSVTLLLGSCFPYWDVTLVATFEPSSDQRVNSKGYWEGKWWYLKPRELMSAGEALGIRI